MSSDSPTWCVMPFSHMNFKPYGEVGACWRNLSELGDYRTQSLAQIWNGAQIQDLRRRLSRGEKPDGCRSCWEMEASGVTSTRQQCNRDYARFAATLTDPAAPVQPLRLASMEIRFSNECNLMCRHCGPNQSSRWERSAQENASVANLFKKHLGYNREIAVPRLSFAALEELSRDFLPSVGHLRITGGEALIQPEHLELLKRLEPFSEKKILEYNSNLHALAYRGEEFLPYWKKYEQVLMRISIDGEPETYGYFRTNGKIESVEKNIEILREGFAGQEEKLFLQGTCTASIYQATRMEAIVRYFNRLGLYFHASLVQYPHSISLQRLPRTLREETLARMQSFLENLPKDETLWSHPWWNSPQRRDQQIRRIRRYVGNCLAYMRSSPKQDDVLDADTVEWISTLDSLHGTDFLSVYPELSAAWPK